MSQMFNFNDLSRQAALALARIGVVGMAASMPISRAAFNISALLMITGWIFSGDWKEKATIITRSAVAVACVVFFAVNALSLAWVNSIGADHWTALKGYSRLLYVPLILSLMTTAAWQRKAWTALLAGMLCLLVLFILDIWWEIPGTRTYGTNSAGQGVINHHIAEGMVLSFLGAYGLHRALQTDSSMAKRSLWMGIAMTVLVGLIHIGQSRTGQLSVLAAYFAIVLASLPKRLRIMGVVLALTGATLLVLSSSKLQDRFALAFKETTTYQVDGERTSVGARLRAWEFSARLVEQAPFWGHGVGSYRPLAYKHFEQSPICELGVCEQPHNQFIVTIVENGLLGLFLIIFIITSAFKLSWKKDCPESILISPFILIFLITACLDSSLKIQAQSFFTITVLGLLISKLNLENAY